MKPDLDPGAQKGVAGVVTPVDWSVVTTQIVNSSGELVPPITSLVTITLPGVGGESHASPIPSPSVSLWSGLGIKGKLSLALDIPSRS